METSPQLPARAWLIVALLWVVGCLNYLDRVIITTMRSSVIEAIPMTDAQFGLLTSVFLWVYAFLSPFAGFLADRFNRSRVIMISLLVWSIITLLTAFCRTFGELLITRALMGVSEACYIPAALALISDYHRGPTRSLATGVHMSGIMVGSGLGGLGGWIAEHQGWQHAFAIFGAVGIVYTGLVFLLLKDRPVGAPDQTGLPPQVAPPPARLREALASLFSRRAFILALAYWGLLGLTGWAIVGWMPTFLKEHFNLPQGQAGLYTTLSLQLSALVGVLLGGYWADRWSRVNPRGRTHVVLIGLLIAAPGVMLAVTTDWLPAAVAGLAIYGLTKSFSDSNMMPILCTVADERYRATGYGVLNFFSCSIGGLASLAGGMLRDAHVDGSRIFQFAAASMLVCALLLFYIRPQPARAS